MKKKSEWVYILTNKSMPGLVKIGMTKRDPYIRANELASQTGIPTKFEVDYAVRVWNSFTIEQNVHRRLDRFRVNQNREFFEIDVKTARKVLDKEAKSFTVSKTYLKRSFLFDVIISVLLTLIFIPMLSMFLGINLPLSGEVQYLVSFVLILVIFRWDGKRKNIEQNKYKRNGRYRK